MSKKTLNDFWNCYERLSEQGECGIVGGSEFQRVQLEWQNAKRPADIEAFIRNRATVTGPMVIDKPCPNCGRFSPHSLTPSLLSECRGCGARWL